MNTAKARVLIMQSNLRPAAKFIAIRILDMQGLSDGACTLSVARIAADCGIPAETARRALRELSMSGALTVTGDPGQRAHRRVDPTCLPGSSVTGVPGSRVTRVTGDTPVSGDPGPRSSVTDTQVIDDPPPGSPVTKTRVTSDPSIQEHEESTIKSTRESASASPLASAEELVGRAHRALIKRYRERYKLAVESSGQSADPEWMGWDGSHRDILACARWACARGADQVDQRITQLIDGMFHPARDRFADARWPWAWVAKNPAEFASPPPQRNGRGRSGAVFLQAKPGEFGGGDFSDEDIPVAPGPQKVIGYG
jgi:hypothetical protein